MGFDFVACIAAWFLAYQVRFDFAVPALHWSYAVETFLIPASVQTLFFWLNGCYRGVWKYFSSTDLQRTLTAVVLGLPVTMAALFFLNHLIFVPRLIWPFYGLLILLFTAGARTTRRILHDRYRGKPTGQGVRVVILGAGRVGVGLVREFTRTKEWNVVGLFDDDAALWGKTLYGVKVLGAFERLPELIASLQIEKVILAIPSAGPAARRRAVEICKSAGVNPLTVPAWSDILSGKVTISAIREVELEDLLGRGPVMLDSGGLTDLLRGQTVLVTGAGGSIGAELCRKIAAFQPKLLLLYELSEPALYQIEQEFSKTDLKFLTFIGDVKNEPRLQWLMDEYHPSIIFHAAAYKHVPLMEVNNAWEVVRNNVLGTYTLAKVASANRVKKFVLISTDKAVNPTNVMGASKRLAEMVCQWVQRKSSTEFVTVRFGNVLGSQGSVIPKFREQIAQGGPITVTHPDITRYFMSIPEAAQLVLQAAWMSRGNEILVLDMGTPIKISDLARLMVRLSGLDDEEIEVVYTGLRPGEKLHEQLFGQGEDEVPTEHPKLKRARQRELDPVSFETCLAWLISTSPFSDEEVRDVLKEFIPEYRHPDSLSQLVLPSLDTALDQTL